MEWPFRSVVAALQFKIQIQHGLPVPSVQVICWWAECIFRGMLLQNKNVLHVIRSKIPLIARQKKMKTSQIYVPPSSQLKVFLCSVNVLNRILCYLSGEGYSQSPFYKPFKLTKSHLYSLWILHQEINSAATQATEGQVYEANPVPLPHPFKGAMWHSLWEHAAWAHRLAWKNGMWKMFWILEEYSGYLFVIAKL